MLTLTVRVPETNGLLSRTLPFFRLIRIGLKICVAEKRRRFFDLESARGRNFTLRKMTDPPTNFWAFHGNIVIIH